MKDDETSFHLISLIEHKSDVAYNVVCGAYGEKGQVVHYHDD